MFYVITGVAVKYFMAPAARGFPGMNGIEYMVCSTVGGMAICLSVVIALRWYRLQSMRSVRLGPLQMPSEYLYIIPSGVCTMVVIPTTTLMYTLPISVMVAMVIMRGAVIVISRIVDAIQIRQGILHRRVYGEENLAVLFALGAVSVHLGWVQEGGFGFVRDPAAMAILSSYLGAYLVRIYIMNYYKNTRPPGAKLDNNGFFAVEQIAASVSTVLVAFVVFHSPGWFGWSAPQLDQFRAALQAPRPSWPWAALSGTAFGVVAFFSVFIFMFKGRTATFAGLVNRLTSLVAGTASTLLYAVLFGGKLPAMQDWASLGFILVAVAFLTRAERRRAAELRR